MKATYIKTGRSSWTVWESDIFGNPRRRNCFGAPREVRDCAEYYGVTTVEYDGFRAHPVRAEPADIGLGDAIMAFAAAERQAHEEAVRLDAIREARHARNVIAVEAGLALGGLVAGLINRRKK